MKDEEMPVHSTFCQGLKTPVSTACGRFAVASTRREGHVLRTQMPVQQGFASVGRLAERGQTGIFNARKNVFGSEFISF